MPPPTTAVPLLREVPVPAWDWAQPALQLNYPPQKNVCNSSNLKEPQMTHGEVGGGEGSFLKRN